MLFVLGTEQPQLAGAPGWGLPGEGGLRSQAHGPSSELTELCPWGTQVLLLLWGVVVGYQIPCPPGKRLVCALPRADVHCAMALVTSGGHTGPREDIVPILLSLGLSPCLLGPLFTDSSGGLLAVLSLVPSPSHLWSALAGERDQ